MTEIWKMTLGQLTAGYASGELSPVDAAKAAFERIDQVNPAINAIFAQMPERALEAARASEQRWRDGAALGPLDGVPMTIKDSVAMKGTPYIRGCAANLGNALSTSDSPPVARIQEAGGVILAKTTMPDFGMFAAGVSSAHGTTRNPYNLAYNTGGSSSGGAASLAAGIGALTIGTDMAGSVRMPAAMCGLAGMKPTQGRVPHLPPSAVRSAGPLARNVKDMATFLTILSGEDLRDFGSIPPEQRRYENADPAQLKGMEIGLCLDAGFGCETEPEIRDAILNVAREVEAVGAIIVPVDRLIEFDPSEALNKLFFLRSRLEYNAMPADKRSLMLPYALRACEAAGEISAIDYAGALEELEKAKAQMYRHFGRLHYMLTPASPVHGFPADDVGADTKSALRHTNFMSLVNQTGQPGAVVNCGMTTQNLPIGIQVIGRRFDDWGVVQLLAALETMLGATPDIAEPN